MAALVKDGEVSFDTSRSSEQLTRHWRMYLGILLIVQSILLVWSARVHTPTWDEPAHLVAGISHWTYGRFDLYSVNPPLIRVVASAPVYFGMDVDVDWSMYSRNSSVRSEVPLGRAFMEDNKTRALDAIFIARLMLIPVAFIGTILCFFVAKDLLGSVAAGMVASFLWAFSPDVLAYGSVITPDLASAVVALACSYCLWISLKSSSWTMVVALGLLTGVAMLVKSIWLILPLVYASVLLFVQLHSAGIVTPKAETRKMWKPWGRLLVACGIAILLVNAFYGFQGTGKSLGSFEFVSQFGSGNLAERLSPSQQAKLLPIAFQQSPIERVSDVKSIDAKTPVSQVSNNIPPCENCSDAQSGCSCKECSDCDVSTLDAQARVRPESGNRFRKTLFGLLPMPLPASYLEGIDVQRRDFESGLTRPEWASYFAGVWKLGGWWYFYLVGLVFKTPLPLLFLIVVATSVNIFLKSDQRQWLGWLCLAAPAFAVLLVISINTGLNRYLRYGLPMLPFLILWGASASRACSLRPKLVSIVLAVCLAMYGWVSLSSGPHWLGYFNQLAGGADRAHYWYADSNIDWGQDLGLVQEWIEDHPDAKSKIHLAYFGSYGPSCLDIDYRVPPALQPLCCRTTESDRMAMGPLPGWYILSKNYLIGHPMPLEDEHGRLLFYRGSPFVYFQWFQPVDRIGQSTLVYHLKADDVNPIREKLGLPLIPTPKSVPSMPESVPADASIAAMSNYPG